ncbi:hypothetical protein BDZ89DRAFT_1141670 [Hymenopellis radicata]|nr:hypothetical protein BDZ89DRAFT_1141670 [Hymenopellis radicata]
MAEHYVTLQEPATCFGPELELPSSVTTLLKADLPLSRAQEALIKRELDLAWSSDTSKRDKLMQWYRAVLCLPAGVQGLYTRDAVALYFNVFMMHHAETEKDELGQRLQILRKTQRKVGLLHLAVLNQAHTQRNPFEAALSYFQYEDEDDATAEAHDYVELDDSDESESEDSNDSEYQDSDKESKSSIPKPATQKHTHPIPAQPTLPHLLPNPKASPLIQCQTWRASLGALVPMPKDSSEYTLDNLVAALDATIQSKRLKMRAPTEQLKAKRAAMGFLIQDMRRLKPALAQTEEWQIALKDSGLVDFIFDIIDPLYLLLDTTHLTKQLNRVQRFREALALMQLEWIPTDISASFQEVPTAFEPEVVYDSAKHSRGRIPSCHGAKFYGILKKNKNMIPNVAMTESVFFLVNLETFISAWHLWLGPCLQARKFYVADFAMSLKDSYSTLCQWLKQEFLSPHSAVGKLMTEEDMTDTFQVTIHRTCKLKASLQRLEQHLHQHDITAIDRLRLEEQFGRDQYQVISCKECYGLPPNQQCSRVIELEHQEVEHILKHGISLVPESERLAQDNKPTGTTPVHSPYELNMSRLAKNPDTVARCSREIIVLVDGSKGMLSPISLSMPTDTVQVRDERGTHYFEPLDFIIYDGLDDESLAESISHQKNLRYMAPLVRGKKFSEHGAGFMGGNGDRQAAGGARGDTFGGYKNEEAETIRGIHVQFDHLVGGAMMDTVAKFACPSIWRRMQADIQSASKLGITGHNIYACNGYCACIHVDVDAGHGLCIQLEWLADRRYDEYGFCQPSWKYWIATEPNTLWYILSVTCSNKLNTSSGPFAVPILMELCFRRYDHWTQT